MLLAITTLLAGLVTALPGSIAPAAAKTPEVAAIPASGPVPLHVRGNGHGHGMSQYGAQGAAIAGLSTPQILSFYYRGAALTTIAPSVVRVQISEAGADTRIVAGPAGLRVTGVSGTLPIAGYRYYRLVPAGTGLTLERLATAAGSHWRVAARGLPSVAYFRSARHYIKLALADGMFTSYLGRVGAARTGSGEVTVNRVPLDDYTAGVVPREMPASWQPAAVQAQAVAARTYARNAVVNAGGGGAFDICDTTMCQVYGGHAHYDSSMNLLWTDDPAALTGNRNEILTYQGAPIFAQFSASDGGATVSGGEPYLPAQADPYDTTAAGDPYLNTAVTASAQGLAGFYGMARVTTIDVTRRTGLGPWDGRVLSAQVNGVGSGGATMQVTTSGDDLATALGLGTTYFRFDNRQTPPSGPSAVTVKPGNAGAVISWHAPHQSGSGAIRSYRISYGGHTITVSASKRSKWIGPLVNGATPKISIRAVNLAGPGPAVTATVRPTATPSSLRPVMATRLFDTRGGPRVRPSHPLRIAIPGKGTVRPTAGSVQLALSIVNPTRSGTLRVTTNGVSPVPVAAIAYHRGQLATATISVPLNPSGTLIFTPSAGTMRLFGDQLGYTAPTGSTITAVAPRVVGVVGRTRTQAQTAAAGGTGSSLSLAGLPGVTTNTRAVLLRVQGVSTRPTWLKVWRAELSKAPSVLDVAVGPGRAGVNTVLVPLGASQRIEVAAGAPGVRAVVTLLGTVQQHGGGRLETFPPAALADNASQAHPALHMATHNRLVRVLGVTQVPAHHVAAVLVQVTVRSAGRAGRLWVWSRGHRQPTPVLAFPTVGTVTSTALVQPGRDGEFAVHASVPGAIVSIDAIGYITAR